MIPWQSAGPSNGEVGAEHRGALPACTCFGDREVFSRLKVRVRKQALGPVGRGAYGSRRSGKANHR